MKPLDIGTLVYIIAAISSLFGFLMLIFSRINPGIKGPLYWSLGSFSIVISSLLFTMDDLVNGYIVFVLSAAFSIMGTGLYFLGIRAYKELSVNYYILAGFVFLQLFFSTLFYSVFSMPNARMVSYSTISILIYLFIIWELKKPVSKPYRLAFLLCQIVFIISAITSLFRIYHIITTFSGDAHSPSSANILLYFFVNITQAMLIFSFMMMVSIKVSEELKVKVEAQRKFFSIIAHDLNGPVGLISVMLNMVNNDNDLLEEQRNIAYKEVEKLSDSTHHLLQNLLFWSRNQLEDLSPKLERFDIDLVIGETIGLLRQISKAKDISIDYDTNESLFCLGDVRMIETVIRNLISNSIKFTNSGGKITITTKKSGAKVIVKIADNGIGMNQKTQKNLFKFNESGTKAGTSGERGTGLGLMLCKEFIEGNNGSLSIQSQENVGTEVSVTLQEA